MNRFVLMAILAGVGQCAVSGADFTSGNLCYDLLADGSVEVAAPDEGMVYGGVLTVPAIVRHGSVQRQVSGIGSHAFSGCRDLTGITLSEGISYIGWLLYPSDAADGLTRCGCVGRGSVGT